LLKDGKPHTKKELAACLDDPLGNEDNIKPHLFNLRKKLARVGDAVICVIDCRRIKYQFFSLKGKAAEHAVMGKPKANTAGMVDASPQGP